MTEDPLRFAASSNFYTYVEARPTSLVDPQGLMGVIPAAGSQFGPCGSGLKTINWTVPPNSNGVIIQHVERSWFVYDCNGKLKEKGYWNYFEKWYLKNGSIQAGKPGGPYVNGSNDNFGTDNFGPYTYGCQTVHGYALQLATDPVLKWGWKRTGPSGLLPIIWAPSRPPKWPWAETGGANRWLKVCWNCCLTFHQIPCKQSIS